MSHFSDNPTNHDPHSISDRLQDSTAVVSAPAANPTTPQDLHKSENRTNNSNMSQKHERERASSDGQISASISGLGGRFSAMFLRGKQQDDAEEDSRHHSHQQDATFHGHLHAPNAMVSDRPLTYDNVKSGSATNISAEEPPSGSSKDNNDTSLSLKVEDVDFSNVEYDEESEGVLISTPEKLEESGALAYPAKDQLVAKKETVARAIDAIVALAPKPAKDEAQDENPVEPQEQAVTEESYMNQIMASASIDDVSSIVTEEEVNVGKTNSGSDVVESFGKNLPPLQSPEAENLIHNNSTKIFDSLDNFVSKGEASGDNNKTNDSPSIQHEQVIGAVEGEDEEEPQQSDDEAQDQQQQLVLRQNLPKKRCALSCACLLAYLAVFMSAGAVYYRHHREKCHFSEVGGPTDDFPFGPDDVHLENKSVNSTDDIAFPKGKANAATQQEIRFADKGFSEVPFWEISFSNLESGAAAVWDSPSPESHFATEWFFWLVDELQQNFVVLCVGVMVLLAAGVGWKEKNIDPPAPTQSAWVHTMSTATSTEPTDSPVGCGCRCSKTLTKFENLLEFHQTFESCGTGRLTHTIREWGQAYPSTYHRLTMQELKILIVGLSPAIAPPRNLQKLSKGERVARVYRSYEHVLQTFTKPQICQLMKAKGLTVEVTANKTELIATALTAGF